MRGLSSPSQKDKQTTRGYRQIYFGGTLSFLKIHTIGLKRIPRGVFLFAKTNTFCKNTVADKTTKKKRKETVAD
ncbi:hypothetical protein HQ45_03610 [Porphyromonas crevioricanis]|uniref:Uncharacterized protein n=1 Tax=Porphyromonas crevioricanis JCM 15906 TaxID=1305617 RepID=T1DRA5_9PORP|nr:hypothetical protein HQ45_03610 [Porphyromonas crevioricanis]GAD04764.1 hypothetical protein PORCRE_460 [Porphyromonas crevioricanis JCM 15906]